VHLQEGREWNDWTWGLLDIYWQTKDFWSLKCNTDYWVGDEAVFVPVLSNLLKKAFSKEVAWKTRNSACCDVSLLNYYLILWTVDEAAISHI
jgi:hypothetical protein